MASQPAGEGGLDHLIERLRLSDGSRLQSQDTGIIPQQHPHTPQPNTYTHYNPKQHQHQHQHQHQQRQSSPSPQTLGPQQPSSQGQVHQSQRQTYQRQYQHQNQYNHHSNRHGNNHYNHESQHRDSNRTAQRGVSLMAYVKSPGQMPATNVTSTPSKAHLMPRQQFTPHGGGQYRQQPRDISEGRQAVNTIAQTDYLERVAQLEIPKVAISATEVNEKQEFRARLESICQNVLQQNYPEANANLSFIPYGSMLSGFAVTGSDMDIICSVNMVEPQVEPNELARLFEGELLRVGIGARALTRTRVPILKICQKPNTELQEALRLEHEKWLQEKDKIKEEADVVPDSDIESQSIRAQVANQKDATELPGKDNQSSDLVQPPKSQPDPEVKDKSELATAENSKPEQRNKKWRREKILGPLDFPKNGVGFQCDISFRGLLGVHNTQLLRCYSACDPRVRDMVLFVKSWAKQRQINNSYSGTLCSYGWVLLVLHFLINVAQPPVLPNLQLEFGASEKSHIVDGFNVAFADDEMQLHQMAIQGRLTQNRESLGSLLRSFFHYYAHQGGRVIGGGFHWRDDVISIRHRGGIVSKASKDWTGASNTVVNNVEVRQRYLLAVECPLEIDHNVARTVHHYGVVAIRDELRRAWNILEAVRNRRLLPEGLFDPVKDPDNALDIQHQMPRAGPGQAAV